MLLQKNTARLLGLIAFMGLWEGYFVESESIFQALRADRPERPGPPLGLALSRMHQGRFAEAVLLLEKEVLPLAPEDMHARCWLGLALYLLEKYDRARPLLQCLTDEENTPGSEPDVEALAAAILAEMDEKGV